ncbi:helix-turn-helix domain-containing protein [Halosegnis sp.]|uniref:helix-turn-helix domain-containing protein n=1 Tax=Halosegnis sp. TaxID=2864959 RepID=UPI0035D522B4
MQLSDSEWAHDVSTQFPDAEFELMAVEPGELSCFQLVRVTASEPEPPVKYMREAAGFRSFSLVQSADATAVVRFRAETPLALFVLGRADIPFEPPFGCQDGAGSLQVTAPDPALSELTDYFEQYGVGFEVESLTQEIDLESTLTPRQRELVLTAVEMGYYDTPRDCTLTELAEAVEVAKSTASETLHRAEGAVMERFAGAARSGSLD